MDQTPEGLNCMQRDKKFTYPTMKPFGYRLKGRGEWPKWVVKGGFKFVLNRYVRILDGRWEMGNTKVRM